MSSLGPADVPSADRPQRIGEYQILRLLGRGGMGVVYEAQQESPRRRVALKVIRSGASVGEDSVQMFRREAQALALLKHPAIAQIYESGVTEAGQHYFAMELVQGQPLDRFIKSAPASATSSPEELRDILSLFIQVCDGVNYAHQRGVIHRDLKPTNLFVTSTERHRTVDRADVTGTGIKILDFGIARIADTETVLSEEGKLLGTFAYMSPEQSRGNPDEVDLRTDVYSLGVVLYEMLTQQLPYVLGSPLHALHVINETAPESPVAVWRKLGRRMSSDLETIVLKALEKEPSRRYQSAWALAEDVTRYLHGDPILARPQSSIYQLRKLVSRHKMPTALAAALLVVLVTSSVVTTVSRGRALAAEAAAVSEAEKSAAISDFLIRMLASPDPYQEGRDVRVVDVLGKAAAEVGDNLAGQPALEAAVRLTIGTSYKNLGLFEESEEELRASVELRRALGTPDLAISLDQLGALLQAKGAVQEAEPLHQEALEIRRELFGDDHPWVAQSLNNLGTVYLRAGRLEEAETTLVAGLASLRAWPDQQMVDEAMLLENLGSVRYARGDFESAETAFRDALNAYLDRYGSDHLNVATSLNNLAITLVALERFEEAGPLYVDALTVKRAVLGAEHPDVASGINNLGMFYYRLGEYGEAELRLREALGLNRRLLGEDHPETAITLNNLGLVLRDTGRFTEAEEALTRALDIARSSWGPNDARVADRLNNLGSLLMRADRCDEAEPKFLEARTIYLSSFDADHYLVATANSLLGECMTRRGRMAAAEPLLVESYETIAGHFSADHGRTRTALGRVIDLYEAWGKDEEAARYRAQMSGGAR